MCRRARFSCTWKKNASWPSLNFEDEGHDDNIMVVNHNDNDVVKLSILSLRKWQVDSHSSRAHWSSTKAWWLDVMTKCLDRVQLSTPCLKQHSTSLPQSTQRTSKSQRSMRCCASSANNAGHLLTKAGCGYDKTCTCYALLPRHPQNSIVGNVDHLKFG